MAWHISFPKYCNLFSTEAWPPPEKILAWDSPFPRPFLQGNSRCLKRTECYPLKSHYLVLSKFPLIYPLSFSTLPSLNNAGHAWEINEKQQLEQPVESWATELGYGLENCCRIPFSSIYDQDLESTLDNNGTGDPKYDPSSRLYFLIPLVTWLFSACLFIILRRDTRKWEHINKMMGSCWTQYSWKCFQQSLPERHSSVASQAQHGILERGKGANSTGVCFIPILSHLKSRYLPNFQSW